MKTLVLLLCLASCRAQVSLPDAPTPQPTHVYKDGYSSVHHSWPRRHAFALEMIGLGVAAGVFFYKTWPERCASKIDGFPYDGTPPCPTSCEADGCYWPGKPGMARHK